MFRNSRSARGEPFETDPRFMNQERPLGVKRGANFGSPVTLLGANPEQVQKLLRCENATQFPWMAAVSARLPAGTGIVLANMGALATGVVGNGAATVRLEFDCSPDTVISLPGPVIDLDVGWSQILELQAANAFRFTHGGNATRPTQLDIAAIASLNESPARGSATRTHVIDASIGAGGPWRLPIPPFADMLRVNCSTDADYANITSLTFASGFPIIQYTGAQLLALKNANQGVFVPGSALQANLVLGAAIARLSFTYELSL